MRLRGERDLLSYRELEQLAATLTFGLSSEDAISEVFHYVRHLYAHARNIEAVCALDVFRGGVGQCGAINGLAAALLELSGLRCRTIACFNPRFRGIAGVSGHSAIEVFDKDSGWSYVDPYLDILAMGVSAEAIAAGHSAVSRTPVVEITEGHAARHVFGGPLTLAELLKYRIYGDQLERLPMVSALRLRTADGERSYGTTWPLNVAPSASRDALFDDRQTVYVRARYVMAPIRMQRFGDDTTYLTPADPLPRASGWAMTEFTFAPRDRLPAAATQPQRSGVAGESPRTNALELTGPFAADGGHCFVSPILTLGVWDSECDPRRSSVRLYEDQLPLGPPHCLHADIRDRGYGRFSHWSGRLYFSASDNTDPNANRRRYIARFC